MKKVLLFLILLLAMVTLNAGTTPERIYSFTKVKKPGPWYVEQAVAWKKVTDKEPKNADAWYNYYSAARYAVMKAAKKARTSGIKTLDEIKKDMEKAVPGSFELLLIWWSQNNSIIFLLNGGRSVIANQGRVSSNSFTFG